MKEIISEQEIKKFNYYGSIYTVHLAVLIISAVPLFIVARKVMRIFRFGSLFYLLHSTGRLKVSKTKKEKIRYTNL